jgi:hypothetical protein
MSSLKTLTIFSLLVLTSVTTASRSFFTRNEPAQCPTCNPTAGLNYCDITTSCITTGANSYCACRAGFKATDTTNDPTVQFRLQGDAFENRVFVPTGTACDTLCDDPFAGPGPNGLCSEVILTTCLP